MNEMQILAKVTKLEQSVHNITGSVNRVIDTVNDMAQSMVRADPTVPHQFALERAVGGYVITIGRDGSRVVCTNITDALLALASYCEETVTVNDKNNADEEEDED